MARELFRKIKAVIILAMLCGAKASLIHQQVRLNTPVGSDTSVGVSDGRINLDLQSADYGGSILVDIPERRFVDLFADESVNKLFDRVLWTSSFHPTYLAKTKPGEPCHLTFRSRTSLRTYPHASLGVADIGNGGMRKIFSRFRENRNTLKGNKKEEPKGPTFKKLFALISPDWPLIIQACVFLVGAAIFEVLIPKFISEAVTSVIKAKEQIAITESFVASPIKKLVASAVLCGLFSGCRGATFIWIGSRASTRLRQSLFDTLLRQETGFFDTTKTGELSSRMTQDCQKVADQVTFNFNVFTRTLITAATTLIFMVILCPALTAAAFVSVPVVVIMSKFYGKFMKLISEKTQEALANANTVAEETLSTMSTVRSFAAERMEAERFGSWMSAYRRLQQKYARAYIAYQGSTHMLPQLCTALILSYGGKLAMQGHMKPDDLLAFVFYLQTLNSAFATIGDFYSNIVQALGAAVRVFELKERDPETPLEPDVPVAATTPTGHLVFKDVDFVYPARKNVQVLNGLSLDIPAGSVVALVGPSGNGKSTVISLLQRLYVPLRGAVFLDGVDVTQYPHAHFHRIVSIVGQEPVLYARTIKENILFGLVNPGAGNASADTGLDNVPSDVDVEEAARIANAHQFISELPAGYDTDVGERGVQLSGGQKQRIAIARALVRRPKVLLLDEATSALDAESEKQVQQAIDNMISLGKITVVVVAHRLSTVKNAHKICVVKEGRIVESGNHSDLIDRRGEYFNLVESQLSHA